LKRFEPTAPPELDRWQMAEKFGWTLEYIDSLSIHDLHEFLQIAGARAKAGVR
jgi:hypothetical protein